MIAFHEKSQHLRQSHQLKLLSIDDSSETDLDFSLTESPKENEQRVAVNIFDQPSTSTQDPAISALNQFLKKRISGHVDSSDSEDENFQPKQAKTAKKPMPDKQKSPKRNEPKVVVDPQDQPSTSTQNLGMAALNKILQKDPMFAKLDAKNDSSNSEEENSQPKKATRGKKAVPKKQGKNTQPKNPTKPKKSPKPKNLSKKSNDQESWVPRKLEKYVKAHKKWSDFATKVYSNQGSSQQDLSNENSSEMINFSLPSVEETAIY